jgi:hypothetical protein
MANSVIWPGSASFSSGSSTPFGFYDNDIQFSADAEKAAKFCATRLGYPAMDVEMSGDQFFACFEEAVTTYGNEIYLYQIRNNYLSLESTSTSSFLNENVVYPSLNNMIEIASDYGTEAGVGGNTTFYSGSIMLIAGQQTYDLNEWAGVSASLAAGDSIEVKQVFYENSPAIMRYFDPYAGTGYGSQQLLDAFGFGTQSPAINFMLMPLNFDISILQAIELNDTIRKSGFSFQIINNQLKIFPVPPKTFPLHFRYIKKSERGRTTNPSGSFGGGTGLVRDISNVPYNNPTYSHINGPGRYWIFEYALALAKEVLAFIRGKYSTVEIPNDSVTLNQADLLSTSGKEKQALIEKLRDDLEQVSRREQLKRQQEEAQSTQDTLNRVPMHIYIG